MESETVGTGPINTGNPAEITIGELAEHVVSMCNSSSEIVYKPLPKDDPVRRRPDITKATEKLNWQPKTPLEEGLTHTIAYFDELLSKEQE
jgi:UDP-glucuronate decarboxylase